MDNNIITEVSLFIDAKVNEYLKKYSQTTLKLLGLTDLTQGCLITGSRAKQHYGITLPHNPKDLDLVLVDKSMKDIYLLANYLMPKEYIDGSFGSIVVTKDSEVHLNPPFASFCSNNLFIEVFEPQDDENYHAIGSDNKYVSLNTLIKYANLWKREKDQFFLGQILSLSLQ